ncbi:MAG TPA: hypothetical protein VFS48_09560, partial [Solirubrobacterales bacterium]|nr:hypothetical protein [Solirubrobacterales bacterium]
RDWLMTPINAGRDLIKRGRGAGSLRLPLVLIAAGVAGGYLLGRRAAAPAEVAESNGASPPEPEPSMEVTTAVEVSRPQPAELDEIVPAAASKA